MELDLSKLLEGAKDHASKNGKIIGRVTRYKDVKINDSEYIGVDIDFENYLEADIKRGQYLAIRSIIRPVIILGQVYSISRSDVFARMGIKEVSYHEDPTTIVTPTYVEIKPITEAEYYYDGEWKIKMVRPAVSPIDPQSPVFIPSPSLITQLLNIPSEGIAIGKIFSGGNAIDAIVRLDEKALTHHVLVVGTTGAGKTTLLKTIVSEAIKANKEGERKIKTLIFDRQGDFVRYLIEKGERFAVIMPVVEEKDSHTAERYIKDFIEWYNCDGFDENEVICNNARIHLIPYSINFYSNIMRFDKITPYFTSRASMYWTSIVEKTFDIIKYKIYEISKDVGLTQYIKRIEDHVFDFMKGWLTPGKLVEGSLELNLNELAEKLNLDLSKVPKNLSKPYPINNKEVARVDISSNKKIITINIGRAFRAAMDDLELYHSTKDLIVRVLRAYENYGIFTVPGTYDFLPNEVFLNYDTVVVDLSFVMNKSASIEAVATIAYKILDDFFKWKDTEYQKTHKGGDLTLVIMDEAHEYFPQSNREDVAKDVVEELINKIMRLGRVRNIGVILATHVPDDLNPLVLQLTNTKIVMRNEEHVLNSLGMEKFKDFLKYAQPGMAIVNSLSFKEVPMVTLLS